MKNTSIKIFPILIAFFCEYEDYHRSTVLYCLWMLPKKYTISEAIYVLKFKYNLYFKPIFRMQRKFFSQTFYLNYLCLNEIQQKKLTYIRRKTELKLIKWSHAGF